MSVDLKQNDGDRTRLACSLRRRAENLLFYFTKLNGPCQMNEAVGETPTAARETRALLF